MMWRTAWMLLMLVLRMMVMLVVMMMMPAVQRRFANVHHHTTDARSCGCDTATGCSNTTTTATPLTVAERIVEQRILVLRWRRHRLKVLLL